MGDEDASVDDEAEESLLEDSERVGTKVTTRGRETDHLEDKGTVRDTSESVTDEHRQDYEEEARNDYIDTGYGSAALSASQDWVRDNHSPEANDGRSHTRTYFDPNDVAEHFPSWQKDRDPEDRRSWQQMANWQDGAQSDRSRGAANWDADKHRWVETFAAQLDATEYQKENAHRVLDEIYLRTYHGPRYSTELVILGILSLLIDNEIRDWENRTYKRDPTQQLLDDLDADLSDYRGVRSLLQREDGDIIFPDS